MTPGIAFADTVGGRAAVLAGTSLNVALVVQAYLRPDSNLERLRQAYDWLDPSLLRAALAYAEAYPDEVEASIRDQERWAAPERVWETYPFTRPRAAARGAIAA